MKKFIFIAILFNFSISLQAEDCLVYLTKKETFLYSSKDTKSQIIAKIPNGSILRAYDSFWGIICNSSRSKKSPFVHIQYPAFANSLSEIKRGWIKEEDVLELLCPKVYLTGPELSCFTPESLKLCVLKYKYNSLSLKIEENYYIKILEADSYIDFIKTDYYKISYTLGGFGINVKFENLSQFPIKIIWDQCSIININGENKPVIHEGIKIFEREKTQLPTVIAPESFLSDIIIPKDSFIKDIDFWIIKPIFEENDEIENKIIKVMMAIEINNDLKYEISKLKILKSKSE